MQNSDSDYAIIKIILYLGPVRPDKNCAYPSHRALIRPGRFDTKIDVPMPDVKGRHDILKLHLKNVQVADGEVFVYLMIKKFEVA